MTDFDYGDFTQQGIDNKVTLKARLNERRYVSLDLQSDVEGPNLTISGNVHDELNNIDYPIGSAPSGNIEITENTAEGSPLNIAQYATATVNVPSSGMDFVIPRQTRNFPDTGRVFIDTNFHEVLPDNIIVQLIGTAYGQPIHALLIAGKATDEGGYAQYIGEATNRIAGQSMTMRLTLGKLADEENWGAYINVNNVQTAFSNVLISGITEWLIPQ